MYRIIYTKKAIKQIPFLKAAHLDEKAKRLIALIKCEPLATPPSYEQLRGDLSGAYSRRINLQHRLIYSIDEKEKTIKIISMWSHYDD